MTERDEGYKACQEKYKRRIEAIRNDIWMAGMNMTGEYQGIWVRFKEIERIFDEYIPKEE